MFENIQKISSVCAPCIFLKGLNILKRSCKSLPFKECGRGKTSFLTRLVSTRNRYSLPFYLLIFERELNANCCIISYTLIYMYVCILCVYLQGFDVICYCANVGQYKEDFDKVREKALKCGASKVGKNKPKILQFNLKIWTTEGSWGFNFFQMVDAAVPVIMKNHCRYWDTFHLSLFLCHNSRKIAGVHWRPPWWVCEGLCLLGSQGKRDAQTSLF